MNVIETIKNRRSIRKYKPDLITEQALEQVLDAARWAPSWANTQCARFIVVRDPVTRARIADEVLKPGNPAAGALKVAPIVIVACAEMGKSGYKKGEVTTDKGDWFMFDVALAMQNITLAAHELGLATVHVGLMDANKLEDLLGVSEGVRVVELTPLGYLDEQPQGPGRKELSEIVFNEKYGHP